MISWETIHDTYPVICEGQGRKGGYKGCAPWNEPQQRCNRVVTHNGECGLTMEQAKAMYKQILKGEA